MKKLNLTGKTTLLAFLESISSLAVMPLSITAASYGMLILNAEMIEAGMKTEISAEDATAALDGMKYSIDTSLIIAGLFFALAVSRLFRALRRREKDRALSTVTSIQAAAFVLCAVFVMIFGFSVPGSVVLQLVYAAAMIAGQIVALVRNRKARNIVFRVMVILIHGFAATNFMLTAIVMFVRSVLSVLSFTVNGLNFSILKEIIRKSFAVEILVGLLLLIFTFSYIMYGSEPQMPTYPDALWYCFAIVTTIGFGDIVAVSLVGRVLSVVLGIYGIIVVALITSIIVNFYGEMKKKDAKEDKKEDEASADSESYL